MSSPNDSTRLNTSWGLRAFEPVDELVQIMANRQDRGLVAALGETVGDLLHDDVGLFVVRLEICENNDIHRTSVRGSGHHIGTLPRL